MKPGSEAVITLSVAATALALVFLPLWVGDIALVTLLIAGVFVPSLFSDENSEGAP